MQNTVGPTANTHGANSGASSPIIFQSFASSRGIDTANRASPTNLISTPVYYATLNTFSDHTENKRSPGLNNRYFRTIDDPHDENEPSLVNNLSVNQLATNECGYSNSRDKCSPIIYAEGDNENRAATSSPNFAPSNHVTGEVELQTSDSPGNCTEKPNVDIDYIGLYQRLRSEEKCRNGDGRRKKKGLYCNENARNPNSLAPHYGLGFPNARHDTSVNATNNRNQQPAANFASKEITTDLEFGTNAVDIFERELSEKELTLDFETSSYILFPERYGNIFPINVEDDKKKNLNWERSMRPYRDESDEGENSIRVDEEESLSDYWSNEREEESACLKSGERSENGLLHASQGHEDLVQPQISAKPLQTSVSHVQSDIEQPQVAQCTKPCNRDSVNASHENDSKNCTVYEDGRIIRMEELDAQNPIHLSPSKRQASNNSKDAQKFASNVTLRTQVTSGNDADAIVDALLRLPNKDNETKVEAGTVEEKAVDQLEDEPILLNVPDEISIDIIHVNKSSCTASEASWEKGYAQSDIHSICATQDAFALNSPKVYAPVTYEHIPHPMQLSGPILDEKLSTKFTSNRDAFEPAGKKSAANQQGQYPQPPQTHAPSNSKTTLDLTLTKLKNAMPTANPSVDANQMLKEKAEPYQMGQQLYLAKNGRQFQTGASGKFSMEWPQNLPGKVISVAGPIGHRTKNNTPSDEQSSTGLTHPFNETMAEKRREHAPVVFHRPQNGNPHGITTLTETPLPPHADRSTKKQQEFAAKRQIRRAVRQAMRNGVRERANLGRGKRGPNEQNQAYHANDDVLEVSQETQLLAENVNAAAPTTVAAGNTVANMAPNGPGSATSPPAAQPQQDQNKLSASRGRVEKSNGGKRSGSRNPATAHLTPEQRRQIRAQRNRESAEKSRVRRKQQTLELEQSVWTLRKENKKCKRRFEQLEEMIRDVEQEAQAIAEEGAGEGATEVLEAVNDSWATVQACKRTCHRTFRQAPNSPEIELKLGRQEIQSCQRIEDAEYQLHQATESAMCSLDGRKPRTDSYSKKIIHEISNNCSIEAYDQSLVSKLRGAWKPRSQRWKW